MTDEILYMLGIIGVGFAVNYTLRALPFLLFSGRDRALPPSVERFGRILSPIIIGALIVYAYSGSAWRTPWPYLAGLLTVGLQLWKRNPLVSIVAGTALYMTLVSCCGCTTTREINLDSNDPTIRVTPTGVWCGEDRVEPQEVPGILESNDIPKTRVVHVLLDPEVKDLREARFLMGCLARGGYTRPVLVTRRHGESFSTGRRGASSKGRSTPVAEPKKIRYKGAND